MTIPQQTIDRHKYSDLLVGFCVDMYVGCHCGLRTTSRIINYLNERLKWGLTDIPSMGSIKNWVEKSGYSIYKEPSLKHQEDDYAIVTDESMMIGSEKMLLTLGMKANKDKDSALVLQDVEVLDISVERSWNAEKIADVFANVEDKLKKEPSYVVSDNACTISKAIRTQGYKHIRDVGHTLAMFIERKYKNDTSFKAYTKALSGVKLRENMRPASYLLPPKQRAIARFMNITPCIQWSKKILKSFDLLSENEQNVFNFLKEHHGIIEELHEITQASNEISKRLKNNGLSNKTIKECHKIINSLLSSKYKGVVDVAEGFVRYLTEEQNKLPDKKSTWQISSDVVESLFGNYKGRKSSNPLNGVTGQVMIIPMLTKIDTKTGVSNICFKNALEKYFLSDLRQWANYNLTENLTVKRRKILNAA